MVLWKRIHFWMVNVLEAPFFRAEMHRVRMSPVNNKKVKLQVLKGGRKVKVNKSLGKERLDKMYGGV